MPDRRSLLDTLGTVAFLLIVTGVAAAVTLSFAMNAAAEGVPLIGISPQNEPGYVPTPPLSWETCQYTSDSLTEFVRDFLGPTIVKHGQTLPIIAPETDGWSKFDAYAKALISDPAALAYLGPIATHSYTGTPHIVDSVQASGHQVWQTEFSDQTGGATDVGMVSALRIASQIHADLVLGNVSAWHSWYMNPYPTTGNDGLTDGTNLTRRAWVIGNWSRFVRPGYLRVQATPSPQAAISVSAFSDPATGRLVVVLVNQKSRDLQQAISVGNGLAPASFAIWTTSDAVALENTGSLAISADGTFTVALPAQSVTTLVSDIP